MWKSLMRTPNDGAAFFARLALGAVMFPHGAQKVLGWFGGQGLDATLSTFSGAMGIPTPFAVLAVTAEFLGALGLIVGLLGRVAAFGIACVMSVALVLVHKQHGFFMNWFGQQAGEGYEYHLLAIGLALVVMIRGSGALSIDRALSPGR